MTRYETGRVLSMVAALGFFVAAGLHLSEYRGVVLHAQQGISGQTFLVATLWLAFAAALLVLGAIVCLVPFGRVGGGRWILAFAGCFPLITAVLQLILLGFTAPTAVFLAVALVTFAAAIASPSAAAPAAVRAA
jgi:hypothetical protein